VFGHRRAARTANSAPLPPTPDLVVREAEQIVCQAWEQVLLERGGRMESAVQSALANCDTARRLVAEAQRGGHADEISAADANLREALDVARRSSLAAERIRDTVRVELYLLARALEQRRCAALADQAGGAGPGAGADPDASMGTSAREPRSAEAPGRRARGPARLVRRLIRACTTGRRRREQRRSHV
jgi:hypothetical protein